MKNFSVKNGSTLLLTLLIISAIFATAIAFASFIISGAQRTKLIENSYNAYYLAESRMEKALYQVRKLKVKGSLLAIEGVSVDFNDDPKTSVLSQDRDMQFDINSADNVESLRLNCLGDANAWIEVTITPYNETGVYLDTSIAAKELKPCGTTASQYDIALPSLAYNANFSVRIKAFNGSVSHLDVNALNQSGGTTKLGSELVITSSGSAGMTSQKILVRMPQRTPVADFFDYIVYSEKTINKEALGPVNGNGNGNGNVNGGGGLDQTFVFQDGVSGYSGTTDARISECNQDTNFEGITSLESDESDGGCAGNLNADESSLMRWELSSIPTTCVVASAFITVYVTNGAPAPAHDLYYIRKNWVENQTTWRSYSGTGGGNNNAGGNLWTTAGAQGADDRGSKIGSFPIDGLINQFKDISLDIEVVQSWITGSVVNYGFIITPGDNNETDGVAWNSENSVNNKPKITIVCGSGG